MRKSIISFLMAIVSSVVFFFLVYTFMLKDSKPENPPSENTEQQVQETG